MKGVWKPTGERDLVKVYRARAGNVLIARHLIGIVLRYKHKEIAGAALGDGDERAERHEHAPVAVQTNDAALWLRQRKAERERLGMPHGAVGKRKIEFVLGQASPRAHKRHRADDDLIGAPRGEGSEKFGLGEHGWSDGRLVGQSVGQESGRDIRDLVRMQLSYCLGDDDGSRAHFFLCPVIGSFNFWQFSIVTDEFVRNVPCAQGRFEERGDGIYFTA